MVKRKLPAGIQDFETIIAGGYTYVDKTELIYQLAEQSSPTFLARPRRFGKSLLLSTIAALFSGKRELFKGLWIEGSDWEWEPYPILALDMSLVDSRTPIRLEESLMFLLEKTAIRLHFKLQGKTASEYLQSLIGQMSSDSKKVVVLVDEYDRPLVEQLEDLEVARGNRALLRQFYSVLKGLGSDIRFLFVTGVTKFAKVSVFSGINNLVDISMSESFSTLLGYTHDELERYFLLEIEALTQKTGLTLSECLEQIKEWYNGYQFSPAQERVFNPFSVLLLLYHQQFDAHWFETGTPTFLLRLLEKREFDFIQMEQRELSSRSFGTFEIEDIPAVPILYQAGYLTIHSYNPKSQTYRLDYPNREVAQAFAENFLEFFSTSKAASSDHLSQICDNLLNTCWDHRNFFQILKELLALIPYDLYLKNERHYHSLFYLIIRLAGVRVSAEVHTQRGRVDAAIEMQNKIIIFEFKLNETSATALEQIREKKYFEFYKDRNVPIYLVGINFNSCERTIDDWGVELP